MNLNVHTGLATMLRNASIGILSAAILVGCRGQTSTQVEMIQEIPGKAAADHLRVMVERDNLYPWTTMDRLDFYPWKVTDEFVHIQINEIHLGDDAADPKTHPTVAFFKLDRESGQWWVTTRVDPICDVPYELYRESRRKRNQSEVSDFQ